MRKWYSINRNNAKTTLICIVLCFTFIDYRGYGYYYFLVCIPFLLHYLSKHYFDYNFYLILLWGLTYAILTSICNSAIGFGASLQFLINYPLLYIAGKYIYNNIRIPKQNFLILLIISIGIISIVSVIKDISINGFAVTGMGRNIPLIGIENKEGYVAATGISTRLLLPISLVSFFFIKGRNPIMIISICYGLLALYCTIRVQSRTSVVLFALIIILGLISSFRSKNLKRIIASTILLSFLIFIILYIITVYSEQLVILDRFENESNSDGGGRLERLLLVLNHLIDYPFGGMYLNKKIEYAHNFWMDCGRVGGLIPLFLLIIITLNYLNTLRLLNKKPHNRILVNLCNYVTLALFTGFFSEPIIEGIPMFSAFFMFLFGFINVNKDPSPKSNITTRNYRNAHNSTC